VSLRLYMDQYVPVAITEGLRRRGVDVLTAHEDGASDWDDAHLLARATELARTMFTQDDDLLGIAKDWIGSDRTRGGVMYAHQRSITIGQAVRDLEIAARVMESGEMRNRIEFLPL
jgi:hypothetical protein